MACSKLVAKTAHQLSKIYSTGVTKYLEGTKNTVSSGSPNKAYIQKSTERPPLISGLNRVVLTSGLCTSNKHNK
jgi:hypothetical protein